MFAEGEADEELVATLQHLGDGVRTKQRRFLTDAYTEVGASAG